MYATIRKYKSQSPVEVKKRVNEGFLPLISKSPGFVAYYAIDAGKNEWASLSVFETKEGAEKSNTAAADWVKKNLSALGAAQVTTGQVIAHKAVEPVHG